MKFLTSPYLPYDFRSFNWTGLVENHVWSANLANTARDITFARIASQGPDADLEITLDPRLEPHWGDFARVVRASHHDATPDQAIARALEALRQIHYADKRISVASRSKLVYRLKDSPPSSFHLADLPPTPNAIGFMRLAFGEQLDRVFA